MSRIEPVEKLMAVLGRLPGVGRRTAERMAVKLARDPQGLTRELGAALADLAARVTICSKCGDLTLRGIDPCALCTSPRRDSRVLDEIRARLKSDAPCRLISTQVVEAGVDLLGCLIDRVLHLCEINLADYVEAVVGCHEGQYRTVAGC